jgi:hypothetical protein
MDVQHLLASLISQFRYYKMLGERTLKQLDQEQLLKVHHPESNSVAIIVNHLHGNMKSRWTDLLTSDGEKPWRNRDMEFEESIKNSQQLWSKWYEGWSVLLSTLEGLNPEDINSTVLIRNQEHRVYEAINRQLAHYAYHIGQIVFLGKMMKGTAWQPLSIPKGQSRKFNEMKFDQGIHGGHHTRDFMDDDATPGST